MLIFVDVNLVCKILGGNNFGKIMIIIYLFIGYQPYFVQKSYFSHKAVVKKLTILIF